MSDLLLSLGGNKAARTVISSLGLPVPPQLRRARGPWADRPLDDRTVLVGGPGGELHGVLASILAAAGAEVGTDGSLDGVYEAAADAWARPGPDPEELGSDILVFDATGLRGAAGLRALYDFFHPRIRGIRRCGRLLVLGRREEDADGLDGAIVAAALDGFVRSAAKELGRRGSTANLVRVAPGAEDRLGPILRFLLSDRSVYISGQPFTVTADVAGPTPESMRRPLDGRVVLVTGAARGIGAATVRRLALEGAKVVCLDRPADDGAVAKLADEVHGVPLPVDVTDPEAPTKINDALTELGGVYAVVHNAGITRDKTLGRMTEDGWDLLMDVNLGAIVRINDVLTGKGGALLDGGRLVLLSSIAGLAGNVGQTNYAASKAAVAGLVRCMAPVLAARGIAVNAIAPGFIETRLTAAIPFATREGARRLCNLSQGGLPIDVAEALTFLCSPGAQGLSGNVIRVCGGSLVGA
jgi:3-oxoacyl-[acyl-carrier protein] reductase